MGDSSKKSATKASHSKEKYLIYGAIAGAISRTVVAPLDRLKILNQVESLFPGGPRYRSGVINSLILIQKEEGALAFWKGNGTNLLRISPVVAMRYYFHEIYKRLFQSLDTSIFSFSITTQRFLAGSLAGVTAAAGVYPMDVVRTRLAVQTTGTPRYKNMRNAFQQIWLQEGWRGFYKGLGISCFGAAPYVATEFTVYETIKDLLLSKGIKTQESGWWSFSVGMVASISALTVAYPTDLLRKRMIMQGMGGEPAVYNDLRDACRKIYRGEGLKGFYRGLLPCYYKVAPAQAITWWVIENCRRVWGD